MNAPSHPHAGFTLIEVMTTLAVAAVAMLIAVPNYQAFARNSQVSRAAASFVQSAHLARTNALRQSRQTLIVLRDVDEGWTGGWIVFTDKDRDSTFTEGTDELLYEQGPLADGIQVAIEDDTNATGTLAAGYLQFNPAGFPRTAANSATRGSIDFTLPGARSVRVIYSQSGRVRRCNIGTEDCPRRDES